MATYTELATIADDAGFGSLQSKVRVAVIVKATSLIDAATPTAAEIEWSKTALANPNSVADDVTRYIIAANKGASVAQIVGATDTAVQNNVDSAVDKFVSV